MIEKWQEIKGNREIYAVSTLGNVKTVDRVGARGILVKGKPLTPHLNSTGYLRVGMNINGEPKSYFVHRLVANCFLEKEFGKDFVNHKDGNKLNNSVDNIEWCTRSENEKHAWRTGLKKDTGTKGEKHGMRKLSHLDVCFIREFCVPRDKEFGVIKFADKFKVTPQTITDILHNRTWIEELPYGKELICIE